MEKTKDSTVVKSVAFADKGDPLKYQIILNKDLKKSFGVRWAIKFYVTSSVP